MLYRRCSVEYSNVGEVLEVNLKCEVTWTRTAASGKSAFKTGEEVDDAYSSGSDDEKAVSHQRRSRSGMLREPRLNWASAFTDSKINMQCLNSVVQILMDC